MKLTIVSGRSGSGKSVALRVLEDLGFYCVDNLPLTMVPALLQNLKTRESQVCVSMDVRNLGSSQPELSELLQQLRSEHEVTLIFLDAEHNTLIQRYSETRRMHPLAQMDLPLEQAIMVERQLLEPIADQADLYLDTSRMTLHQLSETIKARTLGQAAGSMILVFESFGFKYGNPKDADFVFDARFLPNPYWEPELRQYSGQDEPVQEFFAKEPMVSKYIWQIEQLLRSWLPDLEINNRSYVTVAIGCTGGRHRSVYVVDQLAQRFASERKVQIAHREQQQEN